MSLASSILSCCFASCLFAEPSVESLRATLKEYAACWESRNENACIDKFLSPDYTRINRNGQLGNAATLRATFQQMGRGGGWRFESATIRIFGDTGLVTQSVSMPLGTGASSREPVKHHQTMLWVRESSGWKVVREHISYEVSPAKPAQTGK